MGAQLLSHRVIPTALTTQPSGTLVLGDGSELANDFLKAGTATRIGAGSDGSRIFLGGITVIHIAKAGDFTSQGNDVP